MNRLIVLVAVGLLLMAGVALLYVRIEAPTGNRQPAISSNQVPPPTPVSSGGVIYRNLEYGFTFSLPDSWKGYAVIRNEWQAEKAITNQNETPLVEQGPEITLRHPKWSSMHLRQDIPIMIFAVDQWNVLLPQFHTDAAPTNPTEIGRNSQYVFALPARYNSADVDGVDEVAQIIASHTLTPTSPAITVLYPNGGESWKRGETYQIKWTSSLSLSAPLHISLKKTPSLLRNPYEWSSIGQAELFTDSVYPNPISNTGTYTYSVPADVSPGGDWQVMIWSGPCSIWKPNDSCYFDLSNAFFSIR